MTLKTWKLEFYPKPANRVAKRDALAHSLRKWEGLREENLERHEVFRRGSYVWSEGVELRIDGNSCALCEHFLRVKEVMRMCSSCPLARARGGVSCDNLRDGHERMSPWAAWANRKDPEPMIAALQKAVQEADHV
jgi:hypothetical protein